METDLCTFKIKYESYYFYFYGQHAFTHTQISTAWEGGKKIM